ncbi:hypothetical protein D8B26_005060 [Coccidioides posadasii str. Silveira]|uniref:uncharacterized protein n=1 Tax=Coccidioides posadasii (strain RMSCC 757 / Silveira) TaxID=443226 RepID=UPI001BEF611F|nr:hypothetical protein D8B26_005060 [Coccidioides posadasii str. Silveira]
MLAGHRDPDLSRRVGVSSHSPTNESAIPDDDDPPRGLRCAPQPIRAEGGLRAVELAAAWLPTGPREPTPQISPARCAVQILPLLAALLSLSLSPLFFFLHPPLSGLVRLPVQ